VSPHVVGSSTALFPIDSISKHVDKHVLSHVYMVFWRNLTHILSKKSEFVFINNEKTL